MSIFIYRILAFAIAIVVVGFSRPALAQGEITIGPFPLKAALTIYVVGDGAEWQAEALIRNSDQANPTQLTIRRLDPDEVVIDRDYITYYPREDINLETPIWRRVYSQKLAGIYQFRFVDGNGTSSAELRLSRRLGFGVSSHNSVFNPGRTFRNGAFVYIPAPSLSLRVKGTGITLWDENGNVRIRPSTFKLVPELPENRNLTVELPIEKTNVVWRAAFSHNTSNLVVGGFPVIFCDSILSAETLLASVETLPDGRVVHHKFQRSLVAAVDQLLTSPDLGKPEDLIAKLTHPHRAWLQEPQRSKTLLGPYAIWPTAEYALRHQVLDPESKWVGSYDTWRAKGLGKTDMAISGHIPMEGLYAGISGPLSASEALARVYSLDAPFNTLYKSRALLLRTTIAALQDLSRLDEGEYWIDTGYPDSTMNSYPGYMAFTVARKNFPEYSLIALDLPESMRQLWTNALRRIFDRFYPLSFTSARNQSAHFLVGWMQFAKGSEDPEVVELTKEYAKRFFDSASLGGYLPENGGPDAGYSGIQHWHIGHYYFLTDDTNAAEALARSYRFFNFTVAPEFNGRLLGSSNFGHRTKGSFVNEQWGGARIFAPNISEVGLWLATSTLAEENLRQEKTATKEVNEFLKGKPLPTPRAPMLEGPYYQATESAKVSSGQWPAERREKQTLLIGNELIVINRSGYYAAIYVGKPSKQNIESLLSPWEIGEYGGKEVRRITPFNGGGISILWSPAFGSSILSSNESPFSNQGVVAVNSEGTISWIDYQSVEFELNPKGTKLLVKGRINSPSLIVERIYTFNDYDIEVEVRVTPSTDMQLEKLIEVFPYISTTDKHTTTSLPNSPNVVESVSLYAPGLMGNIEIFLDRPTLATESTIRRHTPTHTIHQLELHLPSRLIGNETTYFHYSIRLNAFHSAKR